MAGVPGDEARYTISGGMQQGPVLMGRDFRDVTFVAAQAAESPLALAQLPPLVEGFTGRGLELAAITALLDPAEGGRAVLVSALAGTAGVGKTALAVQAGNAAREAGWFRGGVLFFDLHGYDDARMEPGQALDALLRAVGVAAEHIPPSTEERAKLYRSVLAGISDPVLIIADNASSEAQVRLLLPGPGPHRVVVTSRHTLAGLAARLLEVAFMDEEAGVALLDTALSTARPDDDRVSCDPEAAARLAKICGGLPLALQITAALLKADPVSTVRELANELADEVRRLEALRYDDGSDSSAPSVAAAFELSYRQLNKTAARVFRLLPVNPGPDLSTKAAAALADLRSSEVRKVLGHLAGAHLIEASADAGGRWWLHDLMRLYARKKSDEHAAADGREQARDRLLRCYLRTAEAAEDHLRALPGTPMPATFADRDKALEWLDVERPNLVAAVTMAAHTGRDQIAMQLPLSLAEYFNWRWRFDDHLAAAMISRDAAHRLGERWNEAGALSNLGSALQGVRRFEEAITALQEAAAICRQTGDRHSEGVALNNLGNALQGVRRFEEAITAHQEAGAIYRQTGDRRGQGGALNNLGNALREARRFEEAITALQEAAVIYRQTGDRHGEGMALNNLGNALREARRFEEAITAHREAAVIYRQTGDRHGESSALNNLGGALREVRRFEEAITAHEEDLAICREIGDRRGEGMALNNLGSALQGVCRFDEAITAHQEAAAICRETGDWHSKGEALNNLGLALQGVCRFEEAITAHREAVAICRETDDRHGEGVALNNLGLALHGVSRFKEAITAYQDAAAIWTETGDRHGRGSALGNLGNALREARQFDEAITAHREHLAICRETGDRHGEGRALNNLGNALQGVHRFEEAIVAHGEAAAIYRETGDRHSERMALTNLELDRTAQRTGGRSLRPSLFKIFKRKAGLK